MFTNQELRWLQVAFTEYLAHEVDFDLQQFMHPKNIPEPRLEEIAQMKNLALKLSVITTPEREPSNLALTTILILDAMVLEDHEALDELRKSYAFVEHHYTRQGTVPSIRYVDPDNTDPE